MGNHYLAILDFNKAIQVREDSSNAFFKRGISKLKSRFYLEALDDFRKAKELEPQEGPFNPGISDGIGCCFLAKEDFEQALIHFDTALSQDSKNIDFRMNRAQCYYQLKDYDSSISDLEFCLKIEETNPKVLYRLGLSYYISG